MSSPLAEETISFVVSGAATSTRDAQGNPVHAAPTETPAAALVAPLESSDADFGKTIEKGYTLYLPPATVPANTTAVRVRGELCTVDGAVEEWRVGSVLRVRRSA